MKFLSFILIISICSKSYGQTYLSRQQVLADIDHYHKILEEVHFNPYYFIDKKEYLSQVHDLKTSIADSISISDFLILMHHMTSLIRDGHTMPALKQSVNREEQKKEIFFPASLLLDSSTLYVPFNSALQLDIPAGAEILSINGRDIKPLLDSGNKIFGGNTNYIQAMTGKLLPYILYLYGIKAPFSLSYLTAEGKQGQSNLLNGVTFTDALSANIPSITRKNNFRIIENKLGYFDFLTMSDDMKRFESFLDSCFLQLKERNVTTIAIDIRQNGGGNSLLGDLLLSYLTKKPFTLMGGRDWRISSRYKEYLLSRKDTLHPYLKQMDGSIWKLGQCKPYYNRFKKKSFSGKVYLLIGPNTFSSANMLADGVKTFKIAELVGESTGENTNDFGEVFTFVLPNSKITLQTTTSFDYGADCDKNSLHPVLPDVLIKSTLQEKIHGRDKVLEYILSITR